jgi:hypothetical protein
VFKRMPCFFAVIAILWTGFAITQEKTTFTADRHKERGLKCEACHKEAQPKKPASAEACLGCHKSLEAVAGRTKDYNANPHQNHITESGDVVCTQCHQGHKADVLLCNNCHQGMQIVKPDPEEKK